MLLFKVISRSLIGLVLLLPVGIIGAPPAMAVDANPCDIVPADLRCGFLSQLAPDELDALRATAQDMSGIAEPPPPPDEQDGASPPVFLNLPPLSLPTVGISGDEAPPEPSHIFTADNNYSGFVGGAFVRVFAGASGVDDTIGMVETLTLDPLGDTVQENKLVTAPARTGSLHIVDASLLGIVTLQAADGTRYSYTPNADHILPVG